jgi:hypothetical protein
MMSRYPDAPHYYGFGPEDGFHVLRNKWVRRSYIEQQAHVLTVDFKTALDATKRDMPDRGARGRGFLVDRVTQGSGLRLDEMSAGSKERRMEQALYDAYSSTGSSGSGVPWQLIVAYQIPLFDRRQRDGWGHIDLLALTADGTPVVIELKTGDAIDTPLRALVEGLANAVAVQANWLAIAGEIEAAGDIRGLSGWTTEAPSVAVQVLAPDTYWQNWQPDGRLGRSVGRAARDRVAQFRAASAQAAYPMYLGAFKWPFDGDPSVRTAPADW